MTDPKHARTTPGESRDPSDDPRVVEVAEAYLEEWGAGHRPDRESYLARYPELRNVVEPCLDGLDLLQSGLKSYDRAAEPDRPRLPEHQSLSGKRPAPLGDFQIVGEIARGGMGVVYEAVQLSLSRRVALKVLPFAATVNERQLHRFKNEAQAAALLHHTHIVPIYAVGCERGVHFYAMQLIEGQSLAVVIRQLREREGRQPPPASSLSPDSTIDLFAGAQPTHADGAARSVQLTTHDVTATLTTGVTLASDGFFRRISTLIVQVADALEHAHQEGVIHRDIKPGNLLLDKSGNAWITDFGLAMLQAENGLTRSGDMLGTFRYMSPEQAGGPRTLLDHRTDIYSLGATFYELLTLEPVFAGETHQELLYQILHVEARSPRVHNPAIPVELETIVLKALSKNSVDRYATAGEMRADIQRYLNHEPIRARPPTVVERLRKWARRHPSAVATVLGILILITALTLISNRRITLEQQRTKQALARESQRAIEAERRFDQARQAVDSLFQISEEELADRPPDNSRRRILEVVLSYYQDFIDERAGDPAAQEELARVRAKVEEILNEIRVVQRGMQLQLLEIPAVRQELHLSEEQATELTSLVDRWSQERQAMVSQLASLSDDQRRSRLFTMASEHEQALGRLLKPSQANRFQQLAVQSQGIFAFKDPDVVRKLDLTSEQRSAIRALERELFVTHLRNQPPRPANSPRSFGGPPGPFFGVGPHRDPQASRRAVNQAVELLTEDQRSRWMALTGEPFDGFADVPMAQAAEPRS